MYRSPHVGSTRRHEPPPELCAPPRHEISGDRGLRCRTSLLRACYRRTPPEQYTAHAPPHVPFLLAHGSVPDARAARALGGHRGCQRTEHAYGRLPCARTAAQQSQHPRLRTDTLAAYSCQLRRSAWWGSAYQAAPRSCHPPQYGAPSSLGGPLERGFLRQPQRSLLQLQSGSYCLSDRCISDLSPVTHVSLDVFLIHRRLHHVGYVPPRNPLFKRPGGHRHASMALQPVDERRHTTHRSPCRRVCAPQCVAPRGALRCDVALCAFELYVRPVERRRRSVGLCASEWAARPFHITVFCAEAPPRVADLTSQRPHRSRDTLLAITQPPQSHIACLRELSVL